MLAGASPLRGSAWRTARRRGVHARPLGSRVPPQELAPCPAVAAAPYLSTRSPRRLPASASAARTHVGTHTRPRRPRFPPLVRGPRPAAAAAAARTPSADQLRGSSHWPPSPRRRLGPGSALCFLVRRLDARSRQPPRRRSEDAPASLRAPPRVSMTTGARSKATRHVNFTDSAPEERKDTFLGLKSELRTSSFSGL